MKTFLPEIFGCYQTGMKWGPINRKMLGDTSFLQHCLKHHDILQLNSWNEYNRI